MSSSRQIEATEAGQLIREFNRANVDWEYCVNCNGPTPKDQALCSNCGLDKKVKVDG